MADVLIKSMNLVSSCNNNYRSQQNKVKSFYVVARSCKIKRFGLRVKSQGFRSEGVFFNNSQLNKKRFLLQGNDGKVNDVKSFQGLTKSQSGLGLRPRGAQNWWEKGLQPNMKEVTSAQDLVDSLLNAGDKLVILDFFSPGCGGCRALHPKICQIAEINPDVQFLQVNYEEHKSMCYSLNVHALPFFRFYSGAHGRLCSFSCTNATIKKFKDALAKHSTDRCSLGPTKGLEEKELISLANNKDLKFTYTPKPEEPQPVPAQQEEVPAMARSHSAEHLPPLQTMISKPAQESDEKVLVTSGR